MSGGFLTPQMSARNPLGRRGTSPAIIDTLRSIQSSHPDLSALHQMEAIQMTDQSSRSRRRGISANNSWTSIPGINRGQFHNGRESSLQVSQGGYSNPMFHGDGVQVPAFRSHHNTPMHSPPSSRRHYDNAPRRGSFQPPSSSNPPLNSFSRVPNMGNAAIEMEPDYEETVPKRRDIPLVEINPPPLDDAGRTSQRSSATASVRTERTDLTNDEIDSGAGSLGRSSDEYTAKQEETEALLGDRWDIFRDRPLTTGESCFQGLGTKIMKVSKVLVVIFLVIGVMGCAVLSKLHLFHISEQIGKLRLPGVKENLMLNHYAWLLAICISLPDVLKVLQTSWGIIFGKKEKPVRSVFIYICVTEVLHGAALYGLAFKVFPFLTTSESLTITMVTGILPALTGTVVSGKNRKWFRFGMRLGALALQCGAAVLCSLHIIFSEVKVKGVKVKDSDVLELRIWGVAGLVLLSLRWVSNYLPDQIGGIKLDLETRTKGSNKACLVSSILRILIAVVLLKTYLVPELNNPIPAMYMSSKDVPVNQSTTTTTTTTTTMSKSMTQTTNTFNVTTASMPVSTNTSAATATTYNSSSSLSPTSIGTLPRSKRSVACPHRTPNRMHMMPALESFFIHIGTTWLCFYFAITACKLCLQRVAFSLPLTLASPVLFLLLQFLPDVANIFSLRGGYGINICVHEMDTKYGLLLGAFILGWVSQVMMCVHVWIVTPIKRLAFTPQLFILPHYCSPVPDLALLHSRRQQKDEVDQPDSQSHPMIYICATMWHENEQEMMQILTSLFRLDHDQCAKKLAKDNLKADVDYYEFEVHILFDDAMCDETFEEGPERKRKKTGRRAPNDFVLLLNRLLDEAASEFLNRPVKLGKAVKCKTPYGARVEWTFPGQNKFIVHLKDKDKIRHRKRWSQVMYMYYLLGYKLAENHASIDVTNVSKTEDFLNALPDSMVQTANSTYVLALDGDVDFQPEAVHLLVDRMKKNPDVAAACGRIKPKGSGPVVWYQKFEYAIGHWLQKSAEHVFGSVLCSPGCFSLFRGRCVMDDNVMKTYTKKPVTARHHLQYDQGEDRWLCTLLLQQGYRVEYCAASEALTFAPEGFKEFFNQRRRWLPSTMANILDLLQSRGTTVMKNKNISNLYIFYQAVLFASSILGPATVLLAIESSVEAVFTMPSWAAYLCCYGPNILFSYACLRFKADTQLNIAIVLSTLFALVMMAVMVGTVVNVVQEGWLTPNAFFMYVLIGSFVLPGIMHPHEFSDLVWGVVYFLCIPSGYLFLIIYSICNLNVISWGTREVKSINEQQEEHTVKHATGDQAVVYLGEAAKHLRNQITQDGDDNGCCSCFTALFRRMRSQLTVNATLLFILEALTRMERGNTNSIEASEQTKPKISRQRRISRNNQIITITETMSVASNDADPTSDWILTDHYIDGELTTLDKKEEEFWTKFIPKYLEPIDKNPVLEAKIKDDMLELRNNSAFAFFFLNGLWLVIMTALQEVKQELNIVIHQEDGPPITVQPLGMLFLGIFALLLIMQVFAMIKHRYGTFLHVLAFTNIRSKQQDRDSVAEAAYLQNPSNAPNAPDIVIPDSRDQDEDEFQADYSDGEDAPSQNQTHPDASYRHSRPMGNAPSREDSFMLRRYIQNTSGSRPPDRYRRDIQVSRDKREVVDYQSTFNRMYSTIRQNSRGRQPAAGLFRLNEAINEY
ncbi:chitin synthase chs-2-like [Haliotis rufescens]|uniref:chitin synthase chs-2-like n=1 Tax=Haliotis rufescens TaxID=6454 RepID=UPI00201E92FA|nr:chitin synthase chs-2-like [Haliotis rufescens]XP_048258559.1 chitin synthase chs-2-like [Haliotis rufescens]XP_048258560.1 chitin synthase chs-2-like [Haliotis rufescens]XP_048258561.1 chitin synthase chs-2-like [Haliotis rufescens]